MSDPRRTIAVVTGARAEFGLLRCVLRAASEHNGLRLKTIASGVHLLPPAFTVNEIAAEFKIDAKVEMQRPHECTHTAEAAALGRGISGFASCFSNAPPDFVLVLGDRIEAFAAAAAAAVSGIRVAHMHGGDRAEGIADESLRHAISKLAHLHLPATELSANRLIAMGEDRARVHVVGSPAIDELKSMRALTEAEFAELGAPRCVLLLHPTGDDESIEHERATGLLKIAAAHGPLLALHPNHDPGRNGIIRAIEEAGCRAMAHLPRDKFIGLLRRARVLVGNSSAGLIEAAAIPIWCVNVGRRQAGRERAANVIDIEDWNYQTIDQCISRAATEPIGSIAHPYGDGRTGLRVAELLAGVDLDRIPLRKRNTY